LENFFEASLTSSDLTVLRPACFVISTASLAISIAMSSIIRLSSPADSSLTLSAPDFFILQSILWVLFI